MKLCCKDLCKPREKVGCVNKKLGEVELKRFLCPCLLGEKGSGGPGMEPVAT